MDLMNKKHRTVDISGMAAIGAACKVTKEF